MDIQAEKLELIARLAVIEDGALIARLRELLDQEQEKGMAEPAEEELVKRAKASLQSVADGKSRNIKAFQEEVEVRKKHRTIS
ncbi:hypothetical protein [Nafulsella turpanensis]|uniref:hypothetical protein n=1 Tax=Nafulsella turpanensis TaxID=1265690 RepID=UPI000347E653|nr:hypothetical protein [Nafulsella turpanensis]